MGTRGMRRVAGASIIALGVVGLVILLAPSVPAGEGTAERRVPPGWTFTMPAGNRTAGLAAFRRFSCHACHRVESVELPAPTEAEGPVLDARTSQLPRGYLAEAIMHRHRSIASGAGADAVENRDQHTSRMVDVNSEMTVQELIDLVEFLATLTPIHASLERAPQRG